MRRLESGLGMALLAAGMLWGLTACGGNASASGPTPVSSHRTTLGADGKSNGGSAAAVRPAGPPMLLDTIAPATGATVGVAMPISVQFTEPVAVSARAAIERHMKVSASVPVVGAWHWFSDTRADWRPKSYWPSGTKVTLDAALTGVGDGNGRYGTHGYRHSFTVGSDVETTVSAPGHWMKVRVNGKLVRTMPIDAGSPSFPSWDGTMAVIEKQAEVRMTSCSVGIACDKGNPNFYDITLPWDVKLTNSGTYVHYSTGDPYPGHSYGSHGCVHLSLADSKWYYDLVKVGDPVTITGSPRGNAAGDNGYADFNVPWAQWLAGSATGQQTTTTS